MFEDQINSTLKTMRDDTGQKGSLKVANATDAQFPQKVATCHVNFEGSLGANHITPRGLKANLVNQFVSVQGIVTKMTLVRPKIQTSVHFCEATNRGHIKNYNDQFNLAQLAENQGVSMEQTNAFPVKDQNDNPLSAEYGYCVYKDSQTITIQEMPERAPTGQLPRSIQVVLENDLVDRVKPGDRIEVNGVFRCMAQQNMAGIFRTVIVATGIKNLLLEKEKPILSE
jgi:DNA replication licensing factor MCM3